MKKELFAELMESMNEALEHAKGKRELRTTVLPEAPRSMSANDVRRMRERLRASQAVFARFLNVSTQLVQAWESDRRQPDGAALRLLAVAEEYPSAVFAGLATPRIYESPIGDAARVRESAAPYKRGSKVSRGSGAKLKQRPARKK
jgi:putative transcriptional regulator